MKKNSKKVDEDAVMAAGEGGAAPSGLSDIGNSTQSDTDVVDKGTGTEDVIGKWDPNKGFMAKDNFFKPKNVLGKGKVMKRYELPYGNKKKKNLKNDYTKGMKVINEDDINAMPKEAKKLLLNTLKVVKNQFKDMQSITKWFEDKKFAIKNSIDHDLKDDKQKELVQKAYNMLEYITQPKNNIIGEASFGKIVKVLACIYIIALFIPGTLTGIYVGLSHGSVFSAITNGIAGGVINVWNGIIGLLLNLPIIGNIIGLLI